MMKQDKVSWKPNGISIPCTMCNRNTYTFKEKGPIFCMYCWKEYKMKRDEI